MRVGLPLNILTFIISVIPIPMIWPFDKVKDLMKMDEKEQDLARGLKDEDTYPPFFHLCFRKDKEALLGQQGSYAVADGT